MSARIVVVLINPLITVPVLDTDDQDLIGVSEPWLPAGVTMLVHVPP
jgi:hypothetical protein